MAGRGVMRRLLYIFFLAVGLVGCSSPQSRRDTALAVWRSLDSNVNQRVEAAEKLIPRGAQVAEIETVLGSEWHWSHLIIPQYDFSNGIRFPDKDYTTLEYDFADGCVNLVFGPESKEDGFWFATARPRRESLKGNAP
jgi:hypothetical protein